MKRLLFSLFRKEDGATAVEFGLIATILFLMLMGIIEFALIMYASNVVENATVAGSRVGITGRVNGSAGATVEQRDASIRQKVREFSSGLLDPAQLNIDHKVFNNFENVDTNNPVAGAQDFGCGGQAVLFTVTYPWDMFTPLIGQFFDNGTYNVRASSLVKNEDFEGDLEGCGS